MGMAMAVSMPNFSTVAMAVAMTLFRPVPMAATDTFCAMAVTAPNLRTMAMATALIQPMPVATVVLLALGRKLGLHHNTGGGGLGLNSLTERRALAGLSNIGEATNGGSGSLDKTAARIDEVLECFLVDRLAATAMSVEEHTIEEQDSAETKKGKNHDREGTCVFCEKGSHTLRLMRQHFWKNMEHAHGHKHTPCENSDIGQETRRLESWAAKSQANAGNRRENYGGDCQRLSAMKLPAG
mmetsp:Transcript_113082/g.225193  ORF Transcript_113082/g.225193 Transcript_113082/m.225193 type:complete len:240 (-) Transcript_113082:304-1023(-)